MTDRPLAITRRALVGSTISSTLAMALASCSTKDNARSAAGGDSQGMTGVQVGVIPVVEVAPLYLGIEKGFFRKRGLDVKPKTVQSGSDVLPAVIGGQVQFGFTNVVSLLVARDRGVPLVALTGAGTSTGDPLKDIHAVFVGPGSRLQSARDLVGKTVAINSWNTIGDTTIKTAVRKDGGDDWKVKFVRVPHAEMPAQLQAGTVDAVWETEPYRTVVVNAGGRILFDNLTATYPRTQIALFFTSERVRQGNPALAAAFTAGLKESMAYASANPTEARRILGTYTKIPPASAAAVILPVWSPELDADSAMALGQAAHDYGTLSKAPDVSGLFAGP